VTSALAPARRTTDCSVGILWANSIIAPRALTWAVVMCMPSDSAAIEAMPP